MNDLLEKQIAQMWGELCAEINNGVQYIVLNSNQTNVLRKFMSLVKPFSVRGVD